MKKFFALLLCLIMLTAPALAFATFGGNLSIDTGHVYPGMEKSFAEGYIPTVTDTEAVIVLPLIGRTYGSKITVEPEFPEEGPFKTGNYIFDVAEKSYTVKNTSGKKDTVKAYLVKLELPLREGFMNGNYSVTFNVSYSASYGVPGQQSFTVRVPIENGRGDSSDAGEKPLILFESGTVTPETVMPESVSGGGELTLKVTGTNIGARTARNIRVTGASQDGDITLTSDLNGMFIEKLEPGESFEAVFSFRASRYAARGDHVLTAAAEYEDDMGSPHSAEGSYRVYVDQQVELVLDKIEFPEAVTSGESVTLYISVYNPSCATAYNVHGQLQMNGMISTSVHLGDIAPQESAQKELLVLATTLSGENKYGTTFGSFDLTYYDDKGMQRPFISQSFNSELTEPMKITDAEKERMEQERKEQQTLSQWWISLLVAIAVIVVLVALILIARFARLMKLK